MTSGFCGSIASEKIGIASFDGPLLDLIPKLAGNQLFPPSILLWIPTHILTLTMNYSKDDELAGVPTIPNVYGFASSKYFIALTNIFSGLILLFVFFNLNVGLLGIFLLLGATIILVYYSVNVLDYSSKELNKKLFRFASIYMGMAMIIIII